jgi:hypothetical protein
MHHQDSPGEQSSPPGYEDQKIEAAVLRFLIDEHPAQATKAELMLALVGQDQSFSERDAVERAIRELIAGGLAHRSDIYLVPSRAAVYFAQLWDGRG